MSEPAKTDPRRVWAWRIVRIAVTVAAFAWVLSRVDLAAVGSAFLRIPLWVFASAIALSFANIAIGTLRWRALLSAYGAPHLPKLALLYRLYLIGFFYNVWLPGGVGGDVVRAVASREAFGDSGATGAMAVVLVERVLGMCGLLMIVGTSAMLWPIEGTDGVVIGSALGIAAGIAAVIAIAVGRGLAPRLPSKLRGIAEKLPRIHRPLPFALALLLSFATQSMVAITGHVFVATLVPTVPLSTSFVIVPLSMATSYIPITAGGAGAREAAFQELFSHVGVSFEDATAASLLLAATYYIVGAIGGLLPVPPVAPPSAGSRRE